MHTETTGKTPRKASKMYGNKPPAARRLAQFPQHLADGGLVARMKSASTTQPQRLADGGFVSAAKRMMGLTPEDPARAARLAEYKANAEREKAAAKAASAQATAPAPQAAISQYSGMSAMQRREKEQGLADGGMIRGPGTGTSDSISTEAEPGTFIMPADSTKAIGPRVLERLGTVPVRLSDGEFKLEPEQVMALGAAVLKLLKDTTHTPVNGEDGGQTDAEVGEGAGHEQSEAGGEGMEDEGEGEAGGFNPAQRLAQMPKQLFADGGMVENDVTRVGNSYSGGNVGGSITVNGQAPAGTNSIVSTPALSPATAPTTPAVAPASPGAAPTAPGVAQASAVAPATTPAPPAPMGWAERNAQRNLQVSASSILDSPDRTAAQAALAPPPAPAPAALGFQSAAQRLGTAPSMPQPQLGFQPRRYADGGVVGDIPRRRYVDGGLTNTDEERAKLLAQIPTAQNQPAPPADGSQQNPLNNEIGRNVMNTLASLPGTGGFASRAGGTAARAAGGALSAERVVPAAWEVVQEGGALANRAVPAAQQMWQIGNTGGGALSRAATFTQTAPQTAIPGSAARMAQLPGPGGGQIAQRVGSEVGEAAVGFNPAAKAATQWADVVQPGALAAPEAGQAAGQAATSLSQAAGRGFGRYAVGAAGLGGAALLAGSGGDSSANTPQSATAQSAGVANPAPVAAGFAPASETPGAVSQAAGLGFNSGAASAQSNTAGDSLSRRGAAEVLADTSSAPQFNVQAPTLRHSGNDWAARKALENAATSASSITNNGGRFDQTGGKNPAALAYQAAVANDNTQRAAEPAAGLAAMREASANNRAALQERSAAAQAQAAQGGALERTLIAERGANTRAGLTTRATLDAARAKAEAAGNKPLAEPVLKRLQETRDTAATIGNLNNTFKDDFAGKGAFGFGADLQLGAAAVAGKDKDAVDWWKNYRKQAELVERHSMFGASLTPGEQESWRSADIGPGMHPDVVKKNLATRAALTSRMFGNTRQDLIDAGHSEERINAIANREAGAGGGGGAAQPGSSAGAPAAAPAPLPPREKLVAGTAYQTPRGTAVWDGKQFTISN